MVHFPVLEQLSVTNYGLYPGVNNDGRMDVEFEAGLTVVLGANGLGKSTFIDLIFRMLTGPYDISIPEGSIGTANLEAGQLDMRRKQTFAARVVDGAANAQAVLTFALGDRRFVVTRALRDLSLKGYVVGELLGGREESLQKELVSASDLGTFGEFIYTLRTMVFFFEDRRQLVWDPAAQRQLLRQLLLRRDQSEAWKSLEREVLQADTRMRNLQAALRREEKEDMQAQAKTGAAPGILARLKALESIQTAFNDRRDVLRVEVEELDRLRRRCRLNSLRAEAELHAIIHELERARLAAVEARFPTAEASMRYILSRLMSDDVCTVCGTSGRTQIRKELVAMIDSRHCLICRSPLGEEGQGVVDISEERITQLRSRLETAQVALNAARSQLDDSEKGHEIKDEEFVKLVASIAENSAEIGALVRQLPPEEQAVRKRYDALSSLKDRVNVLRSEIKVKREQFASSMTTYRDSIRCFADDIKREFDVAARGFLLEESALTWAPTRQQIGQAGGDGLDPIEYPAFSVEMSGSDFGDLPVRRDGPDQVSESQREFIDLAFRMALVQVAAPGKTSTILMDAPESSLDAVFVRRAAAVLARFANSNPYNRLIVMSNLAAGEFVPETLIAAEVVPARRSRRIVDLFKLGVPTRAIRELNDEYQMLRRKLFDRIGEDNERVH